MCSAQKIIDPAGPEGYLWIIETARETGFEGIQERSMTEKTSSQSQKKSGTSNPLFGFDGATGFETLRKMADENLARTQTMLEELSKFEASSREQLAKAIDESARVMHESVNYAAQMSSEWRKATLDATQKTLEMMTPSK